MEEVQRRYVLLTQNVDCFLEHMEVLFLHVGKHRFVLKTQSVVIFLICSS